MPTNKELEKRMKELDRRIRLLEAQEKLMETGNQQLVDAVSHPFISLEWFPEKKVWIAQLGNAAVGLHAVAVAHDSPAQALQMLLQKLQQKVS